MVNDREVEYSNLAPGNYRFRVLASNNSGVWNEEGAFLDFSIAPAYYQTNWFRALCVLTFLAMLWTFYQLRVLSIERRHRELDLAAEKLQRSEAYLSEAQRLSHTGSFGWTVSSGKIYWSEETFRIFQYDWTTTLTLELVLQRVHPEDVALVKQTLECASRDGKDYGHEYRLLMPDGSVKYLQIVAHAQRDKSDELEFVGAVTDVTAAKRAEEAQSRLNRELRAISNCNQALLRAVDEQVLLNDVCRIVCEDAGYRMSWVGYAECDHAKGVRPVAWAGTEDGYLAAANITWADTEEGRAPIGIAIRTGESACIQDFTTGSKATPWRESALQRGYRSCIAMPLKDETANPFGALTIYSTEPHAFPPDEIRLLEGLAGDLAFGITVMRARVQRKQAEEALHQSEQKYRSFFEQNLAGNYISRPDGQLLACNPAYTRMFGFASEEEAKQTNFVSLYTNPEKREEFLHHLKQQGHLCYEKEFRRKDGSPLHVTENAIGTFSERGELCEIHGFLIDDTERRQTEEQLRQAQKMEAVGRLSGGIAHDFNNIMAVIIGHSQLLLDQPGIGVSARRRVREILDSSHRAANLTRQLLAFSRKQVLQPMALNLNRVIEGIDKMIRRLIGDDIEVRTLLAADLENVNADPGQMEQVIINFCVNARDAMPEGGRVTIETLNVEVDEFLAGHHFPMQPGRYVRLAVSDTGIGMSEQTLSQIFEPFFTTKGPEKGTGLGLAMVYGIVKQSGGHVWAYSEPGHGSTFSVYLPTVIEEAESCEPTSEPLDIKRGSETILLVEDAPSLRALIRELLEGFGYTVLEAEDAARAHQIAGHHKDIALLLTDISLPKTSGAVMAKSLLEKRPGLKVLYMSAHSTGVVDCKVQQAGADFLQKPFTQEALAQKLRSLLDSDIVNDPTA